MQGKYNGHGGAGAACQPALSRLWMCYPVRPILPVSRRMAFLRRRIAKTDPKVLERLMEQAKETATRAISIRIPIADLERAERIAGETGVGYQTVLKRAIREGLRNTG